MVGFKIYSDTSDGTDWINLSENLDIFFESNTTIKLNGKIIRVNYFDMKFPNEDNWEEMDSG